MMRMPETRRFQASFRIGEVLWEKEIPEGQKKESQPC